MAGRTGLSWPHQPEPSSFLARSSGSHEHSPALNPRPTVALKPRLVMYKIKHIDLQEALSILRQSVPQASTTVRAAERSLAVTALEEDHQKVVSTLEMIDQPTEDQGKVVVVYKIDRLARDGVDILSTAKVLKSTFQVHTVSTADAFDTRNISNALMNHVQLIHLIAFTRMTRNMKLSNAIHRDRIGTCGLMTSMNGMTG